MIKNDAAAAIAAFLVVVATTPLMIRLCHRIGVLDQPGALKVHTRPIPRLGGVAIAIAIAAGMIASGFLPQGHILAISAFALVWLTGLLDDLRELSPVVRLAAQIVSACLLWREGFGPPVASAALSLLGTVCIVVLCVNAMNFWDGLDGLAAGVAGIAALAFCFAFERNQNIAAALACSTAAACAGFLIFNLKRAIFMGDSGSTLLGFALAFLSIDFYRSNQMTPAVAAFPTFLAALPILDAGLAIVRRLRNARSPALGDRSHIYDLFARGCSARAVALTFFAVAALLDVLGWLALQTQNAVLITAGALILAGLLAISIRLGALRGEQPQVSSPSIACEVEARPASRE